jgi:hypothetical protein
MLGLRRVVPWKWWAEAFEGAGAVDAKVRQPARASALRGGWTLIRGGATSVKAEVRRVCVAVVGFGGAL